MNELINIIYKSSYMFRPNCRTIFRMIFEQVECTIDIVFIFTRSRITKIG